jgi:uncharacterized membrane-anchored protein YhcB (DUF1043 family)
VFSLITLISVAAAALILGCLLGVLLTRTLSPQEQKARTLESKLQDSEKQLTQYQQEVTQHFAQTADLVNSLTQSYKDVHEHLASDALKLANVDISRQLLKSSESSDLLSEPNMNESEFHPPKDWAPKTPGSEGTLSESFGLKENSQKDADTHKAAI